MSNRSFSWVFDRPGSVRWTNPWRLDIPLCRDYKTSDRHLFFFKWHWHGVLFVTANGKLKAPLHIGKLALDTSCKHMW